MLERNAAAAGRHRIGPNAITRMAEAITACEGKLVAHRVFASAGLADALDHPPTEMVDEADVAQLHTQARAVLGTPRARSLSWVAGRKTGDYLLAHRIPKPAQRVMRALPATLAARALTAAISRNAWTFVGSGTLSVRHGRPLTLTIKGCPLCRGARTDEPCCDYFAATFERLFAVLVHADARVVETACAASGAPACTFEVRWPRARLLAVQSVRGTSSLWTMPRIRSSAGG